MSGTPAGRLLGYVRAVARRMDLRVDEPIASIPERYEERPPLRRDGTASNSVGC